MPVGWLLVAVTEPATGLERSATRPKGVATGREFILLVTALMATTALGIDLMLPAFPEIREQFGMAARLHTGHLDRHRLLPRHGCRTVVVRARLRPVRSPHPHLRRPRALRRQRRHRRARASWQLIVVARFVWGLGAAGPRSLSVAMIRDRYEGDTMARLMSMIMAVFLLVPIVAPGVGAGLIAVLPWRAVFWLPALDGRRADGVGAATARDPADGAATTVHLACRRPGRPGSGHSSPDHGAHDRDDVPVRHR